MRLPSGKRRSIEACRCLFASAALLVLPKKAEVSDDLTAAVQALVDLRLEMLKAKNFAEADRIRDELAEKGIQLKDGKGQGDRRAG